jgi:hypothetical protein
MHLWSTEGGSVSNRMARWSTSHPVTGGVRLPYNRELRVGPAAHTNRVNASSRQRE